MNHQNADLDEFNNENVLRIIWATFAEYARSPSARSEYFSLIGTTEENSVCGDAFKRCEDERLIQRTPLGSFRRHEDPYIRWDYLPFKRMVLKVYYSALGMGLVLPSDLRPSVDFNLDVFHFTLEGIKYFSGGFISVDDAGYFGQALAELQDRVPTFTDGQRELLLEAQRCLKAGCYRAAIILVGVANEDACSGMVDAIAVNLKMPQNGSSLLLDWNNCCDGTLNFSRRWKSATRILETMKPKLRKIGTGEPWFQWWEMVPGSLSTLGEAVRIARNSAAHNGDRTFSKAEVALLLSAMPTQIEMIASITEFLTDPPIDLSGILN